MISKLALNFLITAKKKVISYSLNGFELAIQIIG